MSALEDTREAMPQFMPGLFSGKIATSALDITDQVMVTITGFNSKLRWGPCKWMPRPGVYPTRGDACIVMFDDRNIPYVIGWWPF